MGDREVEWREGMTVNDLLSDLGETYPYAAARIDDRIVSRPNFHTALVPDECQFYLIQLVAGG